LGSVDIGIEPDIFARAIDEATDPEKVKLIPHFVIPDPLVYQIGLALKNVLENDPLRSRLFSPPASSKRRGNRTLS